MKYRWGKYPGSVSRAARYGNVNAGVWGARGYGRPKMSPEEKEARRRQREYEKWLNSPAGIEYRRRQWEMEEAAQKRHKEEQRERLIKAEQERKEAEAKAELARKEAEAAQARIIRFYETPVGKIYKIRAEYELHCRKASETFWSWTGFGIASGLVGIFFLGFYFFLGITALGFIIGLISYIVKRSEAEQIKAECPSCVRHPKLEESKAFKEFCAKELSVTGVESINELVSNEAAKANLTNKEEGAKPNLVNKVDNMTSDVNSGHQSIHGAN